MNRRELILSSASMAGLATVGMPTTGQAHTAARAVEAARKFSGTRLNVVWEAGLQAQDPLLFSGPKWLAATGIKLNIIEFPSGKMYSEILRNHKSGIPQYDVVNVLPSWMPDLVRANALEPLDWYIDHYRFRDELKSIAPVYRNNHMTVDDRIFGFPDDGDVLVFYYRADILNDPALRIAFKEKHEYDLPVPPESWSVFDEVGSFITEFYQGKIYGAGIHRHPDVALYMFQERFRVEGGRFFDSDTMQATVNSDAAIKVFTDWLEENEWMPPGVQTWNFIENLSAFLQGQTAMTISWPPYGRWAAGYGSDEALLNWVPKSAITDQVGYALTPGGYSQLAGGYALSVSSTSREKEAAFLFIQWLNSEEISLQRVQLPYALRDPFRENHYISEQYRNRWHAAPQYLETLRKISSNGLLDLSIIQTDRYDQSLRHAIARLWNNDDPQTILDDLAAEWDRNTEEIGVETQKEAYLAWAAKPNAYPKADTAD